MARAALLLIALVGCSLAHTRNSTLPRKFDYVDDILRELNMTHSELFPGPPDADFVYTYHQKTAHFSGPAFDGGQIDVTGCSGLQHADSCGEGDCRNNPAANCCKDCGPCPRGQWQLSKEIVYHNMPHCYALTLISGGCANRGGFLIHGGDGTTCAAGNPSDGCIVIESDEIRYKIKGGGILNVLE
eukprot:m.20186 g.20186  ORF g.20186 m.20186 type:complete len:186 (-) comp3509_c0_seq1:91-648(-)